MRYPFLTIGEMVMRIRKLRFAGHEGYQWHKARNCFELLKEAGGLRCIYSRHTVICRDIAEPSSGAQAVVNDAATQLRCK